MKCFGREAALQKIFSNKYLLKAITLIPMLLYNNKLISPL